ncbi:MAG: ABC transporter permease [Calditrichaeota bacterium]|nr:MAG: ABC transporter permease [Calditrichota bacterium]
MSKTLTLIKRELRTKIFTKGFIIGTILGPFVIVGFTFSAALFELLSADRPMTLHIIDETERLQQPLREMFQDTLDSGEPRFQLTFMEPRLYAEESQRQTVRQAIEDGAIDAVIIIPANVFESDSIVYIAKTISDFDVIRLIRSRVGDAVNRLRLEQAGFDPQLIESLTRPLQVQTRKIEKGKETEKAAFGEFGLALFFLMVLYITILLYGAAVMRGVLEEKTNRILEVLLSSGNPFQLMIGKVLGVGSVGLIQYLIWAVVAIGSLIAVGAAAPNVLEYVSVEPGVFVYFILFFLVGYFQFSTLYGAVGAASSTQEDAQALSTPITFLIVIPFILAVSAGFQDPSAPLTRWLSFAPFFAPILMFLRIILARPPLWEIALCLGINILAVLFFTWVAARIYRVGILMYGKRPTVPELLRWIRYK